MAYVVSLKDFEGPLDLLLHLISRAKVRIEDIFVSEITEQYLASIEDLSGLDMDAASEFLQMAATLLEIKSRALLPKPPKAEEEDPEAVLLALQEAFVRVLLRAERSQLGQPAPQRIERDTFTIGECILHIQRRVLLYKRVLFFDLFPVDATRSEIVTTFLAMLELLKANRITIRQEDIYAPIVIEEGKGGVLRDDADGADRGD